MADAHESISAELTAIQEAGRWRERPVYDRPVGRVVVARGSGGPRGSGRRSTLHNWASNDYLGCSQR